MNIGQEFWRRLGPFRRITGGMHKRFRPLEPNRLRPGNQTVCWQAGMLEERNWLARETPRVGFAPCFDRS